METKSGMETKGQIVGRKGGDEFFEFVCPPLAGRDLKWKCFFEEKNRKKVEKKLNFR